MILGLETFHRLSFLFFFSQQPVTEAKVGSIIFSSSNANCELDPIPIWLVKERVDELTAIIARMERGCPPENWKVALVIPLLKELP